MWDIAFIPPSSGLKGLAGLSGIQMVTISSIFFWIIILITFIWMFVLTMFLLKTIANYNHLTRGVTDKTLSHLLSELIDQDKLTKVELQKMFSKMHVIEETVKLHIQKIGLVRFNPFADTGGDQSFTLALLDKKDNGIIMTSLYARTGVRWYIKTVKNGKGIEHELSQEEKEALKKAK